MKTRSNLILLLVLVACIALSALQGQRVIHLREAESFYRWIVSVATQIRIFEELIEEMEDPDTPSLMDKELFDRVLAVAEAELPDSSLPVSEMEGEPQPKLIRLVQEGVGDVLVWKLACSDALADERADFHRYRRQRRLATLGTQFDPSSIYTDEGVVVGIGNMFFGFRKMAANLLWLQVDKYWHQGMMHRMVPLMKTTVTLDPNFVDAFIIGAWHLAYNYTALLPNTPEPLKEYAPEYDAWVGPKEVWYYRGIEFLKDGIRKNPRNYKLYFDLGYGIYEIKLADHPNAVRYLSEAIRHRHDRWVPRTLYLSMQNNGQYREALAGWKDYLEKFPDNLNAPRFIKYNEALIHECEGEGARARAQDLQQAAEDARQRAAEARQAAAEARSNGREDEAMAREALADDEETAAAKKDLEAGMALEEAKQHYDNARAVWNEVLTMMPESDNLSAARIARLDALEMLEEERYLEAIANLEFARWASSNFFDEGSEMIIKIKRMAGLPLTFTERHYELQREEAERVGRAKSIIQYPCRIP